MPTIGSTSTPAIDPTHGTIFVETESQKQNTYIHRLHLLDVTTGHEKQGSPANISGNGLQLQRPGLLLSNGIIYVAFGSYCDQGSYHGWVYAYQYDYTVGTLAQKGVFNATPSGSDGGIWMGGSGVAADASGTLFTATGNGTWDGVSNFGDTVLKLNFNGTAFTVSDYFTPFDQCSLNTNDLDLGSGGVLLLPDQSGSHPHLLVTAGKEGRIYLVDRDNMGKNCGGANCNLCTSDSQILQESATNVIMGGMWNTPVYWNGLIYFGGYSDVLRAFPVSNGQIGLSSGITSNDSYNYYGAGMSISANGSSNGILWSLGATSSTGPAILRAHDAASLSLLYSSDVNTQRDTAGTYVKFSVPTVANGKLYVGEAAGCNGGGLPYCSTGELGVYGLFPWNQISGSLVDVSVASDGTVWGVNSSGVIFKYVGGPQPWQQVSGNLSRVTVGSSSNIWGVNSSGAIVEYIGGSQVWQPISGSLSDISVASDGTVWGVNSSGVIFKYVGGSQVWQQISGNLSHIAVGSSSNIWGVNSSGVIFKYVGGSQVWQSISGSLSDISVASDGTVWGVNSGGVSFKYVGGTQVWQQMPAGPNRMAQVSVGGASVIWGLDTANDIYTYTGAP